MSLRLAFMGSPEFALPALEAIHDARHDIAAVYTQPPRPAGRGKKPRPVAVQRRAEELGLPVRNPASLRDPQAQAEFAALGLDVAVVAAYGLILPRAILDAPRHGCINIHPSLLPRWRGAAPIQRAVMSGDAETGLCIMRMEEGLDSGPVLLRETTPIQPGETAGELHDRLAATGAGMVVEALAQIEAGTVEEAPQDHANALYAAKIDKAEAHIDWTRAASDVLAHIHGLSPFPGAWTEVSGTRLKLHRAEAVSGDSGPPGLVQPDGVITCAGGAIRILEVQRAGKPPMAVAAFLNGFDWPVGETIARPGAAKGD